MNKKVLVAAAVVLFGSVAVAAIWHSRALGTVAIVSKTDDLSDRLSQAIRVENQEPVLLDDRKAEHLPEGFDPAQGGPVYRLGDLLFGFVLQKNMNTPLLDLPAGVETDWGGVMVSGDDGAYWQSFLMYLNPKTNDGLVIRHNPVGLFVERGQLFVDVADAAGAGSGEGQLTRYVLSNDLKEWIVEGCYYLVPESYGGENGFHELQPSTNCLALQL